jgi:hypothetical protein
MPDIQDRVLQGLSPLLGLKLSIARYFGNVRLFHFGALSGGGDPCGQYALHLLCPWRLENGESILTGLNDWYVPADPISDGDWDAANGGSIQEAVLSDWMGGETGLSIMNRTENLVVTHISVDSFGGFSLDLTGGVRLAVFPCASRGEQWRIFQPGEDSKHFVIGESVIWE